MRTYIRDKTKEGCYFITINLYDRKSTHQIKSSFEDERIIRFPEVKNWGAKNVTASNYTVYKLAKTTSRGISAVNTQI